MGHHPHRGTKGTVPLCHFCIIGQKSLNLPQNQAYGRDSGFYMEEPGPGAGHGG